LVHKKTASMGLAVRKLPGSGDHHALLTHADASQYTGCSSLRMTIEVRILCTVNMSFCLEVHNDFPVIMPT
jgi:hypothetical protein